MTCTLRPHIPFKLVSSYENSLVLDSTLDCESVSKYVVVVTVRCSPSLSTTTSVFVEVANVNCNMPVLLPPKLDDWAMR